MSQSGFSKACNLSQLECPGNYHPGYDIQTHILSSVLADICCQVDIL